MGGWSKELQGQSTQLQVRLGHTAKQWATDWLQNTVNKHTTTNQVQRNLNREEQFQLYKSQATTQCKTRGSKQGRTSHTKGLTGLLLLRTAEWSGTLEVSNYLNLSTVSNPIPEMPPFPEKHPFTWETRLLSKKTSATWSSLVLKTRITKASFLSFGSRIPSPQPISLLFSIPDAQRFWNS